jgi:uncharacterized membrane protein YvlD (DUF360 family)
MIMDSHNLFLTRATYRLLRAEYGAALIAAVVVALIHLGHIRWPVFIGMFVYIDLIGYLPGAVAYRRAHGGDIRRGFYVLYNCMHSFVSAGAVAGLWCLLVRPEWALLALPIHLCGDRAIFGNFLKPFGLSFEPVTHPAYKEFAKNYDQHIESPQPSPRDVSVAAA